MKKIIPDESTAIQPLGWYERNGQLMRAYEITCEGERVEVHMLDQTPTPNRGTPYTPR